MNYYQLGNSDNGENIRMKRNSHNDIRPLNGQIIDGKTIELPFKFTIIVGEEYGYNQFKPAFKGEIKPLILNDRLFDYYEYPPLMTPRLINAVKSVGVDNLQTFPTLIMDSKSNEILDTEYLFVNIVGVISCANMEVSEHESYGDNNFIFVLKIKKDRIHGQLMFRLAEDRREVIVAEPVARAINEGGFKGIETYLLEES